MSAKTPKKLVSRNKNDIKTTVIIVLGVIVAVQAFLLFNKGKTHEGKPAMPAKALPVAVGGSIPMKRGAPAGSAGKIAFIIDDWGYTTRNCKYLKEIKTPLAIAILPNLRHSDDAAQCAAGSGKNVMLHLPLEPYYNNDHYPDNYLITTTMKPAQVIKILEDSLNKMPLAQGVNNHMGSKATEDGPLMKTIFKCLKKRRLFFVDSMTSPRHSVCGGLADQMALPFANRDVFLDNVNTKEDIAKQIAVLAQKARKKGFAIAIGHDRELTLQVIAEQIPLLEYQGFSIVSVKDLLRNK